MFRSKDKRAKWEPALAAGLAEAERPEALPMARLAAEVMARGFGPGGPGFAQGGDYAAPTADDITRTFQPQDFDGIVIRLREVAREGLQVLEHQSLIQERLTEDRNGDHGSCTIGYATTRRGRASLEDNALEQALRGAGGEPARAARATDLRYGQPLVTIRNCLTVSSHCPSSRVTCGDAASSSGTASSHPDPGSPNAAHARSLGSGK
jgi:hypothetical protein